MNSGKSSYIKLLPFVFIAALIFSASTEADAQASLPKAIAAHIKQVRADAAEYKEARKIVYGDVDGDGTKDAIVRYTLEGAGGGNSWSQNLAVFLKTKGVYKMAADETVGGKFFRSFDVLRVENKTIIGATETCPDGDAQGMCQNPAKAQVKYVLSKGKLQEN